MNSSGIYNKKQTLEEWIQEALSDPDKDGECTMLSLVHVHATSVGPTYDEIHSHKLGPRVDVAALAAMFRHKAASYGQDLPGVQSFCLLAFYANRSEPQAKHPFRVQGETDFGGLSTEGPTETGKLAQNMRLSEAIVQGSFRQNSLTFDALMRITDITTRQNAQVMEQNYQAMQLIQNMMIERAKLDHEYKIKEDQYKMAGQMLGFVPALANSIFGTEVFPQATADTALIEGLAENLTVEDIPKLQAVLPPKVWPLVANRLKLEFEKRKKAAEKSGNAEHNAEENTVDSELG